MSPRSPSRGAHRRAGEEASPPSQAALQRHVRRLQRQLEEERRTQGSLQALAAVAQQLSAAKQCYVDMMERAIEAARDGI
jgi:hypothetical protein